MLEQTIPLQPVGYYSGADLHAAACGGAHGRADGPERGAQAGVGGMLGAAACAESMLE